MARKSSIDRLPKQIKEVLAELMEGRFTIDEIVAHLNLLGADVSRSAVGRHVKKAEAVAATIIKSRALADAITSKFGDENTSKVARMNVEIMHSLLMQMLTGGEDGQPVTLDSKDAMFLATAFEKLAKAQKSDVDLQIQVALEKARRDLSEKAADAAAAVAKKQGLSKDTVQAIRSEILGVA